MRNPRVTMLSLLLVVAVVACESPTDAADQAAIPEFDPPLAPTGLALTVVSSAQIDLSWTDGSVNELSFGVERREGQTGDWDEIDTADRNDITFSDDTVDAETEYCYRVRAINPWGNSTYTNESCGTTPA